MGARAIAVDLVLDDAEEGKVDGHDDESDDPGDCSDEGGEQAAADTSAEREEEGDECERAGDGVEDHDASEALGGLGGGFVEAGAVDVGHDGGGVIANVLWVAVVLVGPV